MPGIVTNSVRDSNGTCEHLTLTVDLDGVSKTIKTGVHDQLWNTALSDDELNVMLRLLARWWKAKGGNLASFTGRVLCGEEGSNMKSYDIITKDITKTNIGTSYVNIPVGANGERSLVNFAGCTQYRLILHANLVGTGAFGFRLVRDSDNAVLYENASIALTGERELDTDWQTLPAAAVGEFLVRLQGKSATAADDPVVRRCILLTR